MFKPLRYIMPMTVVISAHAMSSLPAIAAEDSATVDQQLINLQEQLRQSKQTAQSQLQDFEQRLKQLEQEHMTIRQSRGIRRPAQHLAVSFR